MRFNEVPPAVKVTGEPVSRLDVDAVVVAVADRQVMAAGGLDPALTAPVETVARSGELQVRPFATWVGEGPGGDWRPARILAVGLGALATCDAARIRRWAMTAALTARERRFTRIAVVLPGVLLPCDEARIVAEGVTLSAFTHGFYKSTNDERAPAAVCTVVMPPRVCPDADGEFASAVQRGSVIGASRNLARSLAQEPANRLTPRIFADVAEQVAVPLGLKVDVLDEDRMAGLDMGFMLGVSRGSAEPPRLVVIRYDPEPPAAARPVLGLVGKGVTFDAGGVSLKPPDGMARMKSDMSGGAAVLAAMKAIATLRAPVPVIGIIPLVENMPDGRALKPGDVVRGASGRTVEVLDTDAEGRLILADALWYAAYLGATHLVDIATLTGSVVVALGHSTSGLFGGPDEWIRRIQRVAHDAGDRCWPLPLFDEYREQLRSDIADVANVGGRPAGAITAAWFLKDFSGNLPWAHLDIAGTAWNPETLPYLPKGPTGVGVGALVDLAFSAATWSEDAS